MKTIDYYMSPGSPWTYLGHARFDQIVKKYGAAVNVGRWTLASSFRSRAACLICAAPDDKRMALAGDLLAALWRDDRDLANPSVLQEIGSRHGVEKGDETKYKAFTQQALERGVFGAPSYVYRDEIFWGQDRLAFLDRALAK